MTVRSVPLCLGLAVALACAGKVTAQETSGSTTAKTGTGASKAGTKAATAPKDNADKAEKAGTKKAATSGKIEKATFGGGCFWCLEAVFEKIPGVKNVVSGYSGGTVQNPSYEEVSTGETGHAEVVRIEFDPELVTYEKLLDVFWACHDPTTLNSQGPDFGTQYRSVVFYHDDKQKVAAEKSAKKLTTARTYDSPIVTELVPEAPFFVAEAYHQDYYRKHRTAPYCRMNIAPKLKKLKLK
ncbi:MAG: methionine-S-sulfoxide reductase [Planctomycetota bacterium]|nr:methionine-S-sulfoxide reductase [Planctomycetota bacterium]